MYQIILYFGIPLFNFIDSFLFFIYLIFPLGSPFWAEKNSYRLNSNPKCIVDICSIAGRAAAALSRPGN